MLHDLLDDLLRVGLRPGRPGNQSLLEQRAGIGELQVLAVVVDMADISQRKDRLAAIAFATGHGGNGAGGGDGGLGGIADAISADASLRSPPNPGWDGPNRGCRG